MMITVVDIGAGLQASYERLTKKFKEQITIYAIEPHPILAEKVRSRSNKCVIVCQHAIWTCDGTVDLYSASDPSSSSTLPLKYENARRWKNPIGKRWLTPGNPPVIRVEAMTLDSFMVKHDIKKIDYLNIDVQGCALQIIESLTYIRIWDSIKEINVKVHTIDFEIYQNQSKNYHVIDAIRKHYFDLKEVTHISRGQEDLLLFYSTLAETKKWKFIGWNKVIERL